MGVPYRPKNGGYEDMRILSYGDMRTSRYDDIQGNEDISSYMSRAIAWAYMRKTSDVAGVAFLAKKIGGKFGLKWPKTAFSA